MIAVLLFVSAMHAQLAAPNDKGVAMGHLHINTSDIAAQKKIWVDVLGATAIKYANQDGVKMPGAVVLFSAKPASGQTEGSAVDHVGVLVASIAELPGKLDAAGFKYTKNPNGKQIMIDGPDGLKLEVTADPSVTDPVRFHHIHFYTADPKAIQAWYFEKFGAIPGKRAFWDAGDIPGANLTYAKAADTAPTKGRALDHIGFEVRDLDAFCKKLEASGVKFEGPIHKAPQIGLEYVFLVDPWGTRIELTEGLGRI